MPDVIDWLWQHRGEIYGGGAALFGLLALIVAFLGVWWFAAAKYQFAGLAAGWIPAAVAALVAMLLFGLGWPITVPLAMWGLSALVRAIDEGAFAR